MERTFVGEKKLDASHLEYFDVSGVERENEFVKPRLLFLITEDWSFLLHRLPIARAARDAGFDVLIATRINQHRARIEDDGFKLIPIHLIRSSKNIFRELRSIWEIVQIYRREKPDIVHHVTVKPVLYGSWAARIARVSFVVNALTGLGFIFIAKGWKASILRHFIVFAYRLTFLARNAIAIFQNPEDLKLFVETGIVRNKNTVLIRGSGVNISHFAFLPEPTGVPVVVLASRMLWDKGVGEFVEAARILINNGTVCRMVLVGNPDPGNPATISEDTLHAWHSGGIIEWWGHREDMEDVIACSNIVVLPSYREGLPKVLLEAASCGRAIVATDVPGCREIVRNDVNGLLVPVRDSKALAHAINILIKNPILRAEMGGRGRKIVEAEFSEEIVVRQTMEIYKYFLRSKTAIS